MEKYRVVDDNSHKVLLETDFNPNYNVWMFAYNQIKEHPEYDAFIDVYNEYGFSHWVDTERIIDDCERACYQ